MSELLERRYRALLKMLPKHYREARGEEMLGALMDGADERRRWPEAREALSLARLSLRTRFTVDDARRASWGVPRLGAVARVVALIGAALLAFGGLDNLNQNYAQVHTLLPALPSGRTSVKWVVRADLPALWLVVYLLLVFGRWLPARVLALGLFVASAWSMLDEVSVAADHQLLAAVVVGATMVARGADARRIGPDRHRLAVGVTLAAVVAATVGLHTAARNYPVNYRWVWATTRVLFLSPSIQPGTALYYLLTVALIGAVAALALRSPVWPLAATLVGAALVVPWAGLLAREGGVIGQGLHRPVAVEGVLVVLTVLAMYKQRRTVRTAAPLPAD